MKKIVLTAVLLLFSLTKAESSNNNLTNYFLQKLDKAVAEKMLLFTSRLALVEQLLLGRYYLSRYLSKGNILDYYAARMDKSKNYHYEEDFFTHNDSLFKEKSMNNNDIHFTVKRDVNEIEIKVIMKTSGQEEDKKTSEQLAQVDKKVAQEKPQFYGDRIFTLSDSNTKCRLVEFDKHSFEGQHFKKQYECILKFADIETFIKMAKAAREENKK